MLKIIRVKICSDYENDDALIVLMNKIGVNLKSIQSIIHVDAVKSGNQQWLDNLNAIKIGAHQRHIPILIHLITDKSPYTSYA